MSLNDRTAWEAYDYAKNSLKETDKPNILARQADEAVEAMCGSIKYDAERDGTKFVGDDRIANIEAALFRALCSMNDVDIDALAKIADEVG